MPRLSVLMPARNASHTIDAAVRSTLRALPADAELVIGDDGSTDDTLDRLDRIGDPRLRVIAGPGRGVAATLNSLLSAVDSEFIARMDADDIVLPGRFARQLRALDGLDAVFTTVAEWRGSGLPRPSAPVSIGHESFAYHLLLTNPVAHSTMAARRSVVDAAGGYRGVPSEDYDLWLRLATGGARMSRLALPGILYRQHSGQVTVADGWRLSSWQDEKTQDAFGDLSERLLGVRRERITALAASEISRPDKVTRMMWFEQEFRGAIRSLPALARMRLVRRLASRAAWFWRRLDASMLVAGADSTDLRTSNPLQVAA